MENKEKLIKSLREGCNTLEYDIKCLEKSKIDRLSLQEVSSLVNLKDRFDKLLEIVPSFKNVELVNMNLEDSDNYISDLMKVGIKIVV